MRVRAVGVVLVVCAVAASACARGDGVDGGRPAAGSHAGPPSPADVAAVATPAIDAHGIRSIVLDDAGQGAVTAEAEITGVEGLDRVVVLGTKRGGAISPTTVIGFGNGAPVATISTDATGGMTITFPDGSAVAAGAPVDGTRHGTVVDAEGNATGLDPRPSSETADAAAAAATVASTSPTGSPASALVVPDALLLTRVARVPITVVGAKGARVDGRTYGGFVPVCESPSDAVACVATVEYGRSGPALPDPVAVDLVLRLAVPDGRTGAAAAPDCARWSAGLRAIDPALRALGSLVVAGGPAAAAVPGIGLGGGVLGATTSLHQVLSGECSTKVSTVVRDRRPLAGVAGTDVALRLAPRRADHRVEPASLTFRPLTITNPAPVRIVVDTPELLAARAEVDPGPPIFAVAVIEEHLDVTTADACGAEPLRSYPTVQKHTIQVVLGPTEGLRSRIATTPSRTPGGWSAGYQGTACTFFKVITWRAELVATDVTEQEAEAVYAAQAPGAGPRSVVLFAGDHELEGTVSGSALLAG